MNEYLFLLTDGKDNTSWRVIRADNYQDAFTIFIEDEECDGFLIEKVYVRFE